MNKTGWIIFSTAVILLLGGLVAYARIANPPLDISGVDSNSVIAPSDKNGNIGDHSKGSEANKVILVEYGDFQCPSCASVSPQIDTLLEERDEVTFIFRSFPLTSIHPNARAAASVAEAAGLQGKYWEMYSALFENQNDWSGLNTSQRTTMFNRYANSVGLDMGKFNTDLTSKNISQKINFDIALGKSLSVKATPAFFLNGKELDQESTSGLFQGDFTSINAKIDEALK